MCEAPEFNSHHQKKKRKKERERKEGREGGREENKKSSVNGSWRKDQVLVFLSRSFILCGLRSWKRGQHNHGKKGERINL
jgi:hypothetical protein